MIDFDAISKTVKERPYQNLPDDSSTSKPAKAVTDAAVDTSIAVLKEYEKQKLID